MIQHFKSLFDHCAWANRLTLDSLSACPPAQSEGTPLIAHVLAAEHIWLSRLQGREPALQTWPSLSLEECHPLAGEVEEGWTEYLTRMRVEDLKTEIDYRTSRGDLFRNRVVDVLMHVVIHGGHHRGQIAQLVSRVGGKAAAGDYILYERLRTSHREGAPPDRVP